MRWKLLAAMGWAGVGFAAMAGAGGGDDTPVLRGLTVVDDAGHERIALRVIGGTASVSLTDVRGETRASLTVNGDSHPSLSLYDARGESRSSLNVLADGTPGWTLYDQAGKPKLAIALPRGEPSVRVYDARGRVRLVRLETD